jgi:hypothetical protein
MNRITTTVTSLAAAAVVVAGPLAVTATSAHADGASARQATAYAVTAKVNKQVVTVGEDVVKIRGKVTPRAAGAEVRLQQRKEGKNKWKGSGKATIKRNGTFVLKDKPSLAGTREYRVLKPAGKGVRKGTSPVLTVDVFAWEKLGSRTPGALSNVATRATALVGTESFYPSLMVSPTAGAPAYVEYTLGRLCTDLRATYALDDRSESGSTGAVKLLVDGVTKVDQGLVVGQAVTSTTDVTDAFRLRYELTSTASPASKPVVAMPEVRCTR